MAPRHKQLIEEDPEVALALEGGGEDPEVAAALAPAQAEPGLLEQLVGGAKDTVSGLTHGMSAGLGDDLYDALGMRGAGDAVRSEQDAARQRSPYLYAGGDTVGSIMNPVVRAVGAAAGPIASNVGALGKAAYAAGRGILEGGAAGGLRGYGDSDPDAEQKQRVLESLTGMAEGAPAGMVAGGAMSLGGSAIENVPNAARGVARTMRRSQMGSGNYRDIAQREGLDYVKNELGDLPDEIGATNKFWPQSAANMSERAGAIKNAAGAREGSALTRAQSEVPPQEVNRDAIYQQLLQLEADAADDPSTFGQNMQGKYRGLSDRLAAGKDITTPRELHTTKRQYDKAAGYDPKDVKGSETSNAAIANLGAANAARGDLDRVMSLAQPDTYNDFRQGSDMYGKAATVENMSRDRAAGLMQRGVGAGLGGTAAYGLTHDPLMALVGATAGGTGAGMAADYGASFTGNIARGAENFAGKAGAPQLGQMMQSAAPNVGGGAAASGQGMLGGGSDPQEQRRDLAGDTRGHLIGMATEQMLDRSPNELGKYADQLEEARKDGSLPGVLYRLMNDPEFKATIYPKLQKLTQEP